MARNRRPPLGARVRATAYYEKIRNAQGAYRIGPDGNWEPTCDEPDRNRWELVQSPVEGIYCGERYLSQRRQYGETYYPPLRSFLVAISHRRRVLCLPSAVEVIG